MAQPALPLSLSFDAAVFDLHISARLMNFWESLQTAACNDLVVLLPPIKGMGIDIGRNAIVWGKK